jgi:DNA-binding protein H-NS
MPKRKARNKASSRRHGSTKTKRTKASSLASMTFDALTAMRDNVDRIISTRAKAERTAIEKQLARLSGFASGGGQARRKSALKGRKVAPKYRNPANPSETWAGRGVRPRWLQAQLKRGRKIEAFAIVRGKRGVKKRAAKRGRRRMVPAKAVPAAVAA